jgi:hypothetical protein
LVGPSAPAGAVEACQQTLDPARRTEYRFTASDGDVLGFGQLVVQATTANPHRYCVRFQTGGRTVTHSWGQADHRRANGACGAQIGASGSGTYQSGPYARTVVVQDKTCHYESFAIRSGGRWFTARFMRYNA